MQNGRGLLELILAILIIGIIIGLFSMRLIWNVDEARKAALKNELTNIKYSLELYRIVEGHFPKDLRDLNNWHHFLRKEDSLYKRKYLEFQVQDKEGYPIDPYGRRFIYDNKTGKVMKEGA